MWPTLYYTDLDNTICTPINLDAQLVLWMENIGLYYVSGCDIQDHSIARLEIITILLPKVQVFWNIRPYPQIGSSRSLQGLQYYHFRDEVIIIFQGQFKIEDENSAVIRNVGNYVITIKLKIRQTLLFIKQITSLSYVTTPCFWAWFLFKHCKPVETFTCRWILCSSVWFECEVWNT